MISPASGEAPYDAISERAAEYLERRRSNLWSGTDQAELEAWLAESTLHRVAYLRVAGAVARAEHLVARNPQEFGRGAAAGARGFARMWLPLLVAASIALVAGLAWPLANWLMQAPVRAFSTDVGGRTLLRFVDGTEFELNTDTAIRYRMSNRERTVWLDRGEAWFHVAHDPANPFAVIVGHHRVSDLGTEFFVSRMQGRLEVALLNGAAALSTDGVQTASLRPGDDAVATVGAISVTRRTPQELADKLAWRKGMLVFHRTKLADVVREFNRYNATKLVIADPSIAGEPITADLKADDFEAFLNLVQTALNLRVARDGGAILISGAPAKAKRTKSAGAP